MHGRKEVDLIEEGGKITIFVLTYAKGKLGRGRKRQSGVVDKSTNLLLVGDD